MSETVGSSNASGMADPESIYIDSPSVAGIGTLNEDDFNHQVRVIEALLFASAEPVSETALQQRLPPNEPVAKVLAHLVEEYRGKGVNLVQVGGGWAFRTAPDLANHLRMEVAVKRRLSRAAVETLAIIAYHQPVTRAEIEDIRGVSVSRGTLDVLLEVGWIRPRGRRNTPGRPLQWGTSVEFLNHFGLAALTDLPGIEELKATGMLDRRSGPMSLDLPEDLEDEGSNAQQDDLFGFDPDSNDSAMH